MADMYVMLVLFKGSPHSVRFHYKSEASAKTAYDILKAPLAFFVNEGEEGTSIEHPAENCEIEDDYGNVATIDRSQVMSAIRTFVPEDLNAQADLQILQAHANVKLRRKVEADPMLKLAVATQGLNLGGTRTQ